METTDRPSREDELRAENAIKLLNLELNYGAEAHISGDGPPDLISRWLDNVTRYEEAYAKAEMATLLQVIGNPELPPLESLDEPAAEAEINSLLGRLFENGIYIDRPGHVSTLDYYQFLTDVFLAFEIPDMKLPGMIHVFSYEEFMEESGGG